MTIRFRCPHCKKPLGVKDHLAGKKAKCPLCQQALVIPTPAPVATKAPEPPADSPPPENVDALAAAALADEPPTNGKAEEKDAGTIDFTCEYCELELHVPVSEAGKRVQCSNPECRRIVKVPLPKAEKPKDWRELMKKGPSAALINQPEKIDEAAWGSQTDKGRVTRGSLVEAGVAPPPPTRPIGVRGWINRILWAAAILVIGVVVVVVTALMRKDQVQKGTVREILELLKDDQVKDPVLRAEILRGAGEFLVHEKPWDAFEPLRNAHMTLGKVNPKENQLNRDLELVEIARMFTELGGTSDQKVAKERYEWNDEVLTQLQQTLGKIQDPQIRVHGVREVATLLIEKNQSALAITIASSLSVKDGGGKSPVLSQQFALLLAEGKSVANLPKEPDATKTVDDPYARQAYAEAYARKKDFDKALEMATAKGPLEHQLDACLGVAAVILSDRNAKAEEVARALPFVEKAHEIITAKKKGTPWQVLQAVRVGARVKGGQSVAPLAKELPAPYKGRAYLEMLMADCDRATAPPDVSDLSDLDNNDKDGPAIDFGWEALARANGRLGRAGDMRERANYDENRRFRSMIRLGAILGETQRR